MIALSDTAPNVDVQPAEYYRLLGYPRGWVLEGRASELAEAARDWYRRNGAPWLYAREFDDLEVAGTSIRLGGARFFSSTLARTLTDAEAHGAVVVGVGAGPEIEQETQKLWLEEKPDEYFFLEMFGSAVVEHLTTLAGARLCGRVETEGMAVLPHYSPGYPDWDISEQRHLLELVNDGLPRRLEVLESGMLRPKKSLLAVFGVTRRQDRLRLMPNLAPCENCSYHPCEYRRAPYRRIEPGVHAALEPGAKYAVHPKALRRWAAERLSMRRRGDGGVDAVFRYDGTTCNNMGRPLTFYYNVELGPRAEGYPIRGQQCAPASNDTGHQFMCRYLNEGAALIGAIGRERPLLGRPLNDVLSWRRPVCSAGCYCDAESREHKWGLVLETIHYALAREEEKNGLS